VIFTLSANAHYNGLFNPDLPLKSTMPFGAKITQVDSTLEMAPPPLFLDPVFWIQIRLSFVLFKNLLNENKVT